ncbi:outer membrane lipoprotein chaperone LolA [Psychrobacter sp. LV10R520-6]|uniref:outer membrane lipoprotein chaperone LolA n=1 Tax=Psychrobacter sp. LV10R520-6 TaxID=1415574 RepID=UPI0024CC5B00|nr:outer membrane lipoprotein chaperone LolA [Psychrobacter sp. LV10R520-6]SNT69214.1 outer membrane lipoprotein carrier protein [Psychrobacter sp. LV10R520-6]
MTLLTKQDSKPTTTAKQKWMSGALAGVLMTTFGVAAPMVALSQSANAAPASNLVAAQRLNKLLTNTKSMTANFTQTTKGASSGTFKGSMSVQRPNNFRWETKSPSEQLIVANSSSMWVYDKDLEQATQQAVDSQVGNTPALLLSGDPSKIDKNFKITQPYATKNYYVLYPKSSDASFKNLSVSFSGGKPVMMVLNDTLGQTTSIKFNGIKLNPSISSSQFKFTPPKGVDVINQ